MAKKRNIWFYLKVVLVFLCLVLLSLGISVYYFLNKLTSSGNLEKLVGKQLSEITKMDVKFNQIGISFPSLLINNATIATDSPILKINSSVEKIYVSPSILKLIAGNLFIDSMEIASSSTDITIKQHKPKNLIKSDNKSEQPEVKEQKEPTGHTLPFNQISLTDINLTFCDKVTNQNFSFTLNKGEIAASSILSAMPFNIDAVLKDTITLQAKGKIDSDFNIDTNLKVQIINAENLSKYIPTEYHSYLKQFKEGSVETKLSYSNANQKISLKGSSITIDKEVKAGIDTEFTLKDTVEGNVKAVIDPVSTELLMKYAKPYLPKEIGIKVSKGKIEGEVSLTINKGKTDINAVTKASKVEIETASVPFPIIVDKITTCFDGDTAKVSDSKVIINDQIISIPSINYTISTGLISGETATNSISIKKMWPIAKAFTGNILDEYDIDGDADLLIKISGHPLNPDIKADAKIDDIAVKFVKTNQEVSIKSGNISYGDNLINGSELSVKSPHQTLDIDKLNYNLAKGEISCEASAKADLTHLWSAVKPLIGTSSANIDIKGNSDVSIKLWGTAKAPKFSGTANFKDLYFYHPSAGQAVDKINGQAKFSSNKLDLNNLSAFWGKSSAKVNGSISNFNKPELNLDINAESIELSDVWKAVLPNLNEKAKAASLTGNAVCSAKIQGKLEQPKLTAELTLNEARLQGKKHDISISEGKASLKKDIFTLSNVHLSAAGQEANIPNFSYGLKDGDLMGSAKGSIEIAELWNIIKALTGTADIDLKGRASVNLNLGGNVSKPELKGQAELQDVYFFHPGVFRPVEKINGPVVFDLDGIHCENATAYWGKSKASITGSLKDFSKMITDFKFKVDPLDLEDAAGYFLKDSGYIVSGKGSGKGSVKGPIEKIKVSCKANSPKGNVQAKFSETMDPFSFPYTDLNTTCVYFNDLLNVSDASLRIFGGLVKAKSNVYLTKDPVEFTVETDLSQLRIEDFLGLNMESCKELVSGPVDGKLTLSGSSSGLASLKGEADINMPTGKYKAPEFLNDIAAKLKKTKFANKFDANKIASGTFKNLEGKYRFDKGRIISDGARASFEQGILSFDGSIGLDTTLDGTAKLSLNRETCLKDETLAKVIGGKRSLDLPIVIKGSLTSPDIDVDLDNILDAVMKYQKNKFLEKGLKKMGLGNFFKKPNGEEYTDEEYSDEEYTDDSEGNSSKSKPVNGLPEHIPPIKPITFDYTPPALPEESEAENSQENEAESEGNEDSSSEEEEDSLDEFQNKLDSFADKLESFLK